MSDHACTELLNIQEMLYSGRTPSSGETRKYQGYTTMTVQPFAQIESSLSRHRQGLGDIKDPNTSDSVDII